MSVDIPSPEAKAEQIKMMFADLALAIPAERFEAAGVDLAALSALLQSYPGTGLPKQEIRDAVTQYIDVTHEVVDENKVEANRDISSVKAAVALAQVRFDNGGLLIAGDIIDEAIHEADNLVYTYPEREDEINILISKLEQLLDILRQK